MSKEKQEAERLIQQFKAYCHGESNGGLEAANAKACATIHVNGIISVLTKINDDYDDNFLDRRIEDWTKVLEHIKQQ